MYVYIHTYIHNFVRIYIRILNTCPQQQNVSPKSSHYSIYSINYHSADFREIQAAAAPESITITTKFKKNTWIEFAGAAGTQSQLSWVISSDKIERWTC